MNKKANLQNMQYYFDWLTYVWLRGISSIFPETDFVEVLIKVRDSIERHKNDSFKSLLETHRLIKSLPVDFTNSYRIKKVEGDDLDDFISKIADRLHNSYIKGDYIPEYKKRLEGVECLWLKDFKDSQRLTEDK